MRTIPQLHSFIAAISLLTLGAGTAAAQHATPDTAAPSKAPAKVDGAAHHQEASSKNDKRTGDPYTLGTCPITGKALGSMGDPDVKLYDGREVRFCCGGCPPKFEKDLAASFTKLDEKIIKDQGHSYPLKTSVVTGKDLPAKPYEFVYGNRLVRVGAESEKASFINHADKFMGDLNAAAIAAQMKDYPLKTCPVSKDALGGSMGEAKNVVVGGRLVRLCCDDCKKDLEKDPSKYIAMIDAAHAGTKDKDPGSSK